MTLWEYDLSLDIAGFCGVDEAGRGPLAGDVYAAAVILDPDNPIEGLNDSKKLTEKRREALFPEIQEKALAWCIGIATVEEIDSVNILEATYLAMRRAVEGLKVKPSMALVDGNRNPGLGIPTRLLVKGDATSASVAAASILAKVARDRYMKELAEQYPEYRFEQHKGYGTALHYEMLDEFGISPVHRMSFLKKYLAEQKNPSSGNRGEAIASQFLVGEGCSIVTAGYRTYHGEIDLIAEQGGEILFVEVKTRSADALDSPSAAVTEAKHLRLLRAAAQWLEENPTLLQPRFDVAEVILAPDTGDLVSVNWLKNAFGLEGRTL